MKDKDGKLFPATADQYFFVTDNHIYACYGETHVQDYLAGAEERSRYLAEGYLISNA